MAHMIIDGHEGEGGGVEGGGTGGGVMMPSSWASLGFMLGTGFERKGREEEERDNSRGGERKCDGEDCYGEFRCVCVCVCGGGEEVTLRSV